MTDARRSTSLALLVAGAFFMENLDGTVITTALPQMARTFGTDSVGLSIGITAYLLALAVFVPMSGWVTDRYGARTIFASAIALFTASSVACAFSHNVTEFTLARVIQGLGGAMMVPVGRLVVLRNTEKRDLVRAIALITWPGLVAPILGPIVGGFISDHASWHWIFFLNVPLGAIALAFALYLVPNVKGETKPFDWPGFFLTAIACFALTWGLDGINAKHVDVLQVIGMLGAGLVVGWLSIRHLKRTPHPLLGFKALRVRSFALTIWGNSFFRCAIGSTPFLLSLLFQEGFHRTATEAGSYLLWVFAGNLAMKPATTWVLKRFGFRTTLLANGLLVTVSLLAIVLLSPTTPYPIIAFVLFIGGLFRSMQFTATNTLGFAEIPPAEMSEANALATTVGGLTFGAGPAVGAIFIRLGTWIHGTSAEHPTLADFRIAFALVSVFTFVSLYDTLPLSPEAAKEVSGHKH